MKEKKYSILTNSLSRDPKSLSEGKKRHLLVDKDIVFYHRQSCSRTLPSTVTKSVSERHYPGVKLLFCRWNK